MASWKEAAGRGGGPEGYRFGDLTRSPIGRVVGGRKAPGTSVLKPRRSPVGRKYGWRRDRPDHRDQTTDFSTTHPALFGSLPASVDLRDGCPALYNQGTLGSCTANAIAAAFQFDQHKEEVFEQYDFAGPVASCKVEEVSTDAAAAYRARHGLVAGQPGIKAISETRS